MKFSSIGTKWVYIREHELEHKFSQINPYFCYSVNKTKDQFFPIRTKANFFELGARNLIHLADNRILSFNTFEELLAYVDYETNRILLEEL